MKKIQITLTFLLIFSISKIAVAGEGMWLPFLLKSLNESEMQSMGMKMTAEDIYSVNKGSLKDAIAHFNGGCTSEIISNEGLLLTNHHCGKRQIQSHSSVENNYIDDGFWAMNRSEEKANPGLWVKLISSMEDVTKTVMAGLKDKMTPEERQSAIDKNINDLKASMNLGKFEEVTVKPFFKGNQYIAIISVTFNDIRLVGAPPAAIGEFGKDTDNWVWPRHSGDFSLFRIYVDKDNNPAEYSADNVPYTPKHFLPVSLDGVAEGDFTLVFGFPGRTNEYLPASAVKQIVEVIDPARIKIRDASLAIMDKAMRADLKTKIQYTSKFAGISNAWKKWQGEVLGLTKTKAVDKKRKYEAEFTEKVNDKRKLRKKYGKIIPELDRLYAEIEPIAVAREYYAEIFFRNVELARQTNSIFRMVSTYKENGEEGFTKIKDRTKASWGRFFKDYNASIDQDVFEALMKMYVEDLPAEYLPDFFKMELETCNNDMNILAQRLYKYSVLVNEEKLMQFLETPPALMNEVLNSDNGYQLLASFSAMYREKIAPKYGELKDQIDALERDYMKAQMEVFTEKRFYPDANSTMRVHYGNVEGYEPKDAVRYYNKTYLKGISEKHIDGDYEYDAPDKLLELYDTKDFGPYAENGKMPVNFIGSNHTTGGNSGSPAIDAHGNLIGLNFDRAWEGTMSDINYDRSICRNIMVDARYILFIIDKFAGAGHLVEEMKLVHPKAGK